MKVIERFDIGECGRTCCNYSLLFLRAALPNTTTSPLSDCPHSFNHHCSSLSFHLEHSLQVLFFKGIQQKREIHKKTAPPFGGAVLVLPAVSWSSISSWSSWFHRSCLIYCEVSAVKRLTMEHVDCILCLSI
jgi:hypothetical protein